MKVSSLLPIRFEIFFFSQILILFGSLIVPENFFNNYLMPVLFISNIFAGFLLTWYQKLKFRFLLFLMGTSMLLLLYSLFTDDLDSQIEFIRLAVNLIFYIFVTAEIIKQVWNSERINLNSMLGLISGYISIGFIGFFLCMTVEMYYPGSFHSGEQFSMTRESVVEAFMYYSYITLLSVGYGDITPVSNLAQKTSILIGLFGQMYNVIITAIVVGKYINQLNDQKKKNK